VVSPPYVSAANAKSTVQHSAVGLLDDDELDEIWGPCGQGEAPPDADAMFPPCHFDESDSDEPCVSSEESYIYKKVEVVAGDGGCRTFLCI
jgi:hypothetical protein